MKNEDEKLREAARMLSANCEGRRDECKGCLFCRDNLSCKIDGIPMWWDSDFGFDKHIVDANKKVSTPTDTPIETDTPTDTPTTRAEILDAAKKIVTGEREKQYGSPEDNFGVIARLWSTYAGREFTPVDVAMMMTLLKVARIKTGHYKADSYIDACGYLACAAEIAGR